MNRTSVLYTVLLLLSIHVITPPYLNANVNQQSEYTEEQLQEIEQIKIMFDPFFSFLACPEISDQDLALFAQQTFDAAATAQTPVTKASTIATARTMHSLIQLLGYNEYAHTIVTNLKKIAAISNNTHLAALVVYLEENTIDLGNPDAVSINKNNNCNKGHCS